VKPKHIVIACILLLGVQAIYWVLRFHRIQKTHIATPPLYFDGKTWHCDGSMEMTQRAVDCAKVGEVVSIRGGKHEWRNKP
jgi:hypothetical protein